MLRAIAASKDERFPQKPLWQAIVTATLGDRDRGMQFLQEAIARGFDPLANGHLHAGLDAFRGFPPYEALLRARE
jgi:hypothetical protein